MRCPVDPIKSLNEIVRVAKYEVALMLICDDLMVGTMGIVRSDWWYGDGAFLADRWHFVLPGIDAATSARLMDEATAIAAFSGLEFIHQGKVRPAKNGIARMTPRAYAGT